MLKFLRKNLGVLGLLVAAMLFFSAATPVLASTTADVVINATPSFISIAIGVPNTYAFGVVVASSVTNTTTTYFTATNTSSVSTTTTIKVIGDWTSGGVGWTASDTGAAGADTAGLWAYSPDTSTWAVIVKKSAAFNNLVTAKAANTNFTFGLGLLAPSSFTDGQLNSNTVRLTMAAS